MIRSLLIVNNYGKIRLAKFYEAIGDDKKQTIINESFHLVSKRSSKMCNFVDGSSLYDEETTIVYRCYATLYFIFAADPTESYLGILDLIQVFVESLDKCFENVCELDLIFHSPKVHAIADEIVMGGLVLETSLAEITQAVEAQNRIEKSENITTKRQSNDRKF
eukprot:GCRY01000036.1.p1 GENE.GCRY01000036.1~~GCRY01000036.1.p1  ORF type:complete len:164 (+),score=40.05 GCRY01000036.1:288-779(+)